MIQFDNLSKYYPTKKGRYYVLKDISMRLPTDKSIGVLGPNGAGKSTLIKILGGADYASRGNWKTKLRISWPLGLEGGLQGSMTGRENARFVARIHGISNTRFIENKVEEFAEIGRYFDEPVKVYSSGMRSRVSFGLTMAFESNFDLLLIDELSAVGDANFKKKSRALLQEKFKSTKIIMVNHSLRELKRYCQAGVVIKDKNLIYFEDIDEAIADYRATYVKD